jgi:superfamily II RNA helicase
MMNGKPQALTSKFKISYNLLLNLLDIGDNNLTQFASKSMITGELNNQMKEINSKIATLQTELDNSNNYVKNLRTPSNVICEYIELQRNIKFSVNKKRKEMERAIQRIKDEYKFLDHDQISYLKVSEKENAIQILQTQYDSLNKYFQSGVDNVLGLLSEEGFLSSETNNLTLLGQIASQIREIHCLVFAKLFNENKLDQLSSKQLVSLFSCFTNLRVQDDYKDNNPDSDDEQVNNMVNLVEKMYFEYKDKELKRNINTGFDYDIHYDLLNYLDKWCETESVEDCKMILQDIGIKKGIFLGEFVKALLKINNISSEFEKIAELTGNIAFLSKLREIPNMTLKYVVTNQSLYV